MSVYFSTAVPIGDTVNKETNIVNEQNSLKTPTSRRQTSWLFSKRAGVEFGASGLQVQSPNL